MTRRTTEAALGAVRAAAEAVLAERGVSGFTVDAVASRSGVAKTTIYRHWDSVHSLLVETVARRVEHFPTPNHGDLRADLGELYRWFSTIAATPGFRELMLDVLAAAGRDPDLARTHQQMMDERTKPIRTVLDLARHRGDIAADIDVELATDLVQGAAVNRLVLRGQVFDDDEIRRLVESVVAGLDALGRVHQPAR